MNQSIISGNLGNDPETFYSTEGNQIVSFSLAFKSGKDKTSWIKVVCFNKVAEIAEKYLHKGAKVLVSATLDQKKWETDDGQQRSAFQLLANQIEFIKTDGRGFDKTNQNAEGAPF